MLFLRFKEWGERQGTALVREKKKKKPSKGKVKLREKAVHISWSFSPPKDSVPSFFFPKNLESLNLIMLPLRVPGWTY